MSSCPPLCNGKAASGDCLISYDKTRMDQEINNTKCHVKSMCLDIQGTKISSMVTKIVHSAAEFFVNFYRQVRKYGLKKLGDVLYF